MIVPKQIIEFNGHVADFTRFRPVFDGNVLDNKTLARLCMSLLHDVGYPDDFLHQMPPILYHYESLKSHDARQCLYVVCDYLKDRPFIPWDPDIVYFGLYFKKNSADSPKNLYHVKVVDSLTGEYKCSSLCRIHEITPIVEEYLGYKVPYSYIVIN